MPDAPCACDRTICSNCSVTTTCSCGVLQIFPTSFAPLSFHSSFSCLQPVSVVLWLSLSCPCICMHSVFLAIWALVNTNIHLPGSVSLFAAAFAVWSAKVFPNKILSYPFWCVSHFTILSFVGPKHDCDRSLISFSCLIGFPLVFLKIFLVHIFP